MVFWEKGVRKVFPEQLWAGVLLLEDAQVQAKIPQKQVFLKPPKLSHDTNLDIFSFCQNYRSATQLINLLSKFFC